MSGLARQGIWKKITTGALALGGVHALVDTASGFIVYRDVGSGRFDGATVVELVIIYNVLAFGGQAIAGLVADVIQKYKGMMVAGAAMAGIALFVAPYIALAGIVLVGIGNAMFHVGAGAIVLSMSGRRTTESGVFVGPGAIGLAAGILAGAHGVPIRLALAVALCLSAVALVFLSKMKANRETDLPKIRSKAVLLGVVCAGCLLGSVTMRALVGGTIAGSWRGVSFWVMVFLAIAACGGKMIGGFVSDRIGWATTSVFALLISLPFVSYLVGIGPCAVVGMFLFQMTMPVTLKAVHHLLPTRPGLAFGIPCVALLAGALPGLNGITVLDSSSLVMQGVILSTMLVALGLHLLVRSGASGGSNPELARFLRSPKPR